MYLSYFIPFPVDITLILLSGPLSLGMGVPVKVPSINQIELFNQLRETI